MLSLLLLLLSSYKRQRGVESKSKKNNPASDVCLLVGQLVKERATGPDQLAKEETSNQPIATTTFISSLIQLPLIHFIVSFLCVSAKKRKIEQKSEILFCNLKIKKIKLTHTHTRTPKKNPEEKNKKNKTNIIIAFKWNTHNDCDDYERQQ